MSSDPHQDLRQASAVPHRAADHGQEFCLITSISGGRWGFPKGIIDAGETPTETALKEALEEAGLRGRLDGEPLGQYRYAKWGRMLTVTAFLMEVNQCEDQWLEAHERQRRWVTADEALGLLDRRPLARLLELALERLQSTA
ncbi:MAG: NUDIX hydrolase [Planctomycetia bacterium]|nr:NUDIX hydrolase [Planctomycetia bacterium]